MAKIEILHNVHRDAGFGLNTVFEEDASDRGYHKRQARTEDEQHELVKVFVYEVDSTDDMAICNAAFQTFNIGSDGLAAQYRARALRSLSVGDVVVVDDQVYSCESVGWIARSPSELNILAADAADKVIRERYEFKPNETLCVTVPLAG